jgi:hypothetical protein
MAIDDRELTAARFDESAKELEAAARHARVASKHFREGEIPRGCARAWAARGYMLNAGRMLDENAALHATKSRTSPDALQE